MPLEISRADLLNEGLGVWLIAKEADTVIVMHALCVRTLQTPIHVYKIAEFAFVLRKADHAQHDCKTRPKRRIA